MDQRHTHKDLTLVILLEDLNQLKLTQNIGILLLENAFYENAKDSNVKSQNVLFFNQAFGCVTIFLKKPLLCHTLNYGSVQKQ